MTRKFAKLFETTLGQILAMRQSGDDGPEVAIHFDPDESSLSVCHFKLTFQDDEAGEAAATALFENIDEAFALEAVAKHTAKIKEMFAGAGA